VTLGAGAVTGTAAAAVALPEPADGQTVATLQDITAEADRTAEAATAALTRADAITAQVAESGLDLGEAGADIDTTDLREAIDRLADVQVVSVQPVIDVLADAAEHTETVNARVADVRTRLDEAKAQKAAAEAAARAQAEAEARAQAEAAAALAAANTPQGARATAAHLASSQYGWGSDQFRCLDALWQKESDWNYQAVNPSSGATGIPQSLPGHKMASAGPDWQTSATTQIRWGLQYIADVYGTPCAAWGHSQATDWY